MKCFELDFTVNKKRVPFEGKNTQIHSYLHFCVRELGLFLRPYQIAEEIEGYIDNAELCFYLTVIGYNNETLFVIKFYPTIWVMREIVLPFLKINLDLIYKPEIKNIESYKMKSSWPLCPECEKKLTYVNAKESAHSENIHYQLKCSRCGYETRLCESLKEAEECIGKKDEE